MCVCVYVYTLTCICVCAKAPVHVCTRLPVCVRVCAHACVLVKMLCCEHPLLCTEADFLFQACQGASFCLLWLQFPHQINVSVHP